MAFVTSSGYAKSYEKNCFREHITESLSINRERRKFYQKLTNGESDRIFNTLIASEVTTLIPAGYFDLKAKPFQKKGLDLFCHEFVSLNRAPEFDYDRRITPQAKFVSFDYKFYKERLDIAIKARKAESIRKISLEALVELSAMPDYYCMTRHMIESIYRFAFFLPIREKEAKILNLDSPAEIMLDVMKLHLFPLGLSYKIDLWSQPIQESGIPILCSEIPDAVSDLNSPELEALKAKVK